MKDYCIIKALSKFRPKFHRHPKKVLKRKEILKQSLLSQRIVTHLPPLNPGPSSSPAKDMKHFCARRNPVPYNIPCPHSGAILTTRRNPAEAIRAEITRPFPSVSRYAGGSLPTLPRDLGNRLLDIVKLDDYQEPYQALKYAPYYSYSTVVMEMKDMMLNNKGTNINHSGTVFEHTRERVVLREHEGEKRGRGSLRGEMPRALVLIYNGDTLNGRHERGRSNCARTCAANNKAFA